MTTIGTTGHPWRATVTTWGAVEPWDGSPILDWYIGADDRWHLPFQEPSVRQRRIEGTPVVETSVRVPSGDAIQRVYAVPGHCVVEVENRSPVPFAVAFTRSDLRSKRGPVDVPVQGIELPAGSIAFGVPHQQTLVVTIPFDEPSAGPLPEALPDGDAVVRGWLLQAHRGARLVLPDDKLALSFVSARCDVLLEALGEPGRWTEVLFRAAEWCRMGEPTAGVVDPVVEAAVCLARSVRKERSVPVTVQRALRAGADALLLAGEPRAAGDADAMAERLSVATSTKELLPELAARPTGELIDAIRRGLVDDHAPGGVLDLAPGWRQTWFGQGVEVHGLITRRGTVSYGIRWHGQRPALLWDVTDAPPDLTLACSALDPSWRGEGPRGEALLAAPPQPISFT